MNFLELLGRHQELKREARELKQSIASAEDFLGADSNAVTILQDYADRLDFHIDQIENLNVDVNENTKVEDIKVNKEWIDKKVSEWRNEF